MSHATRKFIAVLLALWLPIFSGNVLAASALMQLNNGANRAGMGEHCDQQQFDLKNKTVKPDH